MTKIVVNRCYGGFSLSPKAADMLTERGAKADPFSDEDRADPNLVAVVEALGASANGRYSSLEVVEIPDDVEWEIGEYDGWEHITEKHRKW